MTRRVRGSLFLDYIRMVRGRRNVDWSTRLAAEDLPFLSHHIELDGWYPMETFERLGVLILQDVAGGQVDAVRTWGRMQVNALRKVHPQLVAENDPRETLIRFQVLRRSFFDFDAVDISPIADEDAWVTFQYHMSALAEQAACYQAMGFLERLLEVAGGQAVTARFHDKAWAGAPASRLLLCWKAPGR